MPEGARHRSLGHPGRPMRPKKRAVAAPCPSGAATVPNWENYSKVTEHACEFAVLEK
jgi:hypothetical protein